MDKRYQVFVSSTFKDLLEERQAVTQALLEMDAIPAGMELFPAANADAWTLIQRVIAESDYYILIVGGRYGSTDEAGIGYTEREYDCAMSLSVPVLAFLHEKPDDIPAGKSEMGNDAREKLAAFRAKVEKSHHAKYWTDAEQLGSRVTRGLLHQTKATPRIGWVRGDQIGGAEAVVEINRLKTQIEQLSNELRRNRMDPPKGSELLQGGADQIPIQIDVSAYDEEALEAKKNGEYAKKSVFGAPLKITWDEAFAVCGALLLQEASEHQMKHALETKALELLCDRDKWYDSHHASAVGLTADGFQTIKIQFIALGLIKRSDRKRTASDKASYWTLTPFGESHLMKLRAIQRVPVGTRKPSGTGTAAAKGSRAG